MAIGIQRKRTPGRVPLVLTPEEEAAIDAEAGIGGPVAMRDPLNPRAGGLPMPAAPPADDPFDAIRQQVAVEEAIEQAAAMRGLAGQGGVMEVSGPGMTGSPGMEARRTIGLRKNPTFQAAVDTNRNLGDLLASGAITADQVRDPSSPFYTPPIHVTSSANNRTPEQQAMMAEKNAAYKDRLAADEAMRRENLQQKIAMRGMSPRERMAQQAIGLMGGGIANPMAIGLLTGDPRAAQLAMEMQKSEAAQALAGAERGLRERQFTLDERRAGTAERQADAAIEANRLEAERLANQDFFNAYGGIAQANPGLQQPDIVAEAERVTGRQRPQTIGIGATPQLGSGAVGPAAVSTPTMVQDMNDPKMSSDAFFAKYLDALTSNTDLATRYLPQIRQRFSESGVAESLADMPWFDVETARKRNELAGMLGLPQVSRPYFDVPFFAMRQPDNYRAEQEMGTVDWLMSLLK